MIIGWREFIAALDEGKKARLEREALRREQERIWGPPRVPEVVVVAKELLQPLPPPQVREVARKKPKKAEKKEDTQGKLF